MGIPVGLFSNPLPHQMPRGLLQKPASWHHPLLANRDSWSAHCLCQTWSHFLLSPSSLGFLSPLRSPLCLSPCWMDLASHWPTCLPLPKGPGICLGSTTPGRFLERRGNTGAKSIASEASPQGSVIHQVSDFGEVSSFPWASLSSSNRGVVTVPVLATIHTAPQSQCSALHSSGGRYCCGVQPAYQRKVVLTCT